jgi:hypothetical protein
VVVREGVKRHDEHPPCDGDAQQRTQQHPRTIMVHKAADRIEFAVAVDLPVAADKVEGDHEQPHRDDARRGEARRNLALEQPVDRDRSYGDPD